ncbi:MAG: apolipoprotein N-acyltransferase [Firmicutes bacterium]|nr:apolipoprotein N-acyltransferase [Bacillota bacterium]
MSENKTGSPLIYLAPLLSGAALILAFPPFEQGWLAWFALLPLLWFSQKVRPGRAFCGGLLFSLPLHIYLNLYLSGVLFAHLSKGLAVLAMVLLLAIIGLFYALFAFAASHARRLKNALLLAAVIPALWVLMEYLRSLGFTGYTIGYLGYTQWRYPPSLNLVSAFGCIGLSFVIVFFQSALLLALGRTLRGKNLVAAAAIFLALFFGGALLPELAPVTKAKTPLQTVLIQGCSDTEEILSGGKEAILQRYLYLTRAALREEPRTQLVLWPETVLTLRMSEDGSLHRRELVRLADEMGVGILYGAQVYTQEHLYNAMILLTPGQQDPQFYYKQRLVPFVEYFPLEDLLNRWLDLDMILGSYSAGDECTLFHYRGTPLAGAICFESYFGDYTRHFARRGGRHLFIATNDVWFGETIGLEQHAQVAALRAAEMGIGVTQIANSGISISFDYRGRELMRTGKAERGFYILPLDLACRPTLYRLGGDFFPLLCFLLVAAAAISVARKARTLLPPPAVSRHRRSR